MTDPAMRGALHRYQAYDLSIEATLPLPELDGTQVGATSPDLRVCEGGVAHLVDDDAPGGARIISDEQYLVWNAIGRFLVCRGEEIRVDAAEGVDPALVRMMILGRCLGAVFNQRQRLVLHAAALRIDDRAVALCGFSGAGKSTLAAALHGAAGCALVADDQLPVWCDGGQGRAVAGFARLKVDGDTALRFGLARQALPLLHPEMPERYYPATRGFRCGELALGRVYVLDREGPPWIEPLSPQQACIELLRYSYAVELLADIGAQARHFQDCADLAQSVPVCRLHTGDDLAALPSLAGMIRVDLA